MTDQTIILIGVGIYMAAMLGIGFIVSGRIQDSADFIVAGRRLPLWLCTFTLFATWFGGGTCMGAAGAAFKEGFLGVIADPFGAALCLFLAGLFYVRIMRRMSLLTVADFFRSRFGRDSELVASICVIPAYVGWVGSQFVAFGYILHTLTGMDTTLAIMVSAFIVLAYTTAGGMWAVTVTDFVQGSILILGMVILLPIIIHDAGGWTAVKTQLPESHFSFFPETGFKEWIWYIEAWLVIGLGSIPGQDLLQRALSAKNERVAQNSSYVAGIMYLTVGVIPVILGMIGSVVLPEVADPEYIMPALGLKYLHPIGMSLFVGALLSALMSSADSALLAPASIIGENVVRYFKRDISEKQVLRLSRWSVPVVGIIALLIGLYFKNIYNLMVNSWAFLLVSLFVPLTAGIYWKKANAPAALASMITGLVAWVLFAVVQSEYPADLIALGISAVVMVVVTWMTRNSHPALPLKDLDGKDLAYADRLGTLHPLSRKRS